MEFISEYSKYAGAIALRIRSNMMTSCGEVRQCSWKAWGSDGAQRFWESDLSLLLEWVSCAQPLYASHHTEYISRERCCPCDYRRSPRDATLLANRKKLSRRNLALHPTSPGSCATARIPPLILLRVAPSSVPEYPVIYLLINESNVIACVPARQTRWDCWFL